MLWKVKISKVKAIEREVSQSQLASIPARSQYPIMLDVRDRPAIVIGGDSVAAEKATNLSNAGARVTVICPSFCAELLELERKNAVTLLYKSYEHGDLVGAFVVIAATTYNPELTEAIWHEAQEHQQLINIVDVPSRCNFTLPSILRRGQLTISVSTGGTCPGLAKRIRQHLEGLFPSAYTAYLQLAGIIRQYTKSYGLSYKERDLFFGEFFTSNILECLVQGQWIEALETTVQLLQQHDIDISVNKLVDDLKEAVDSNGNSYNA